MQAKLRIGQPGDKYEQEADRIAEQIMMIPDPIHRNNNINDNSKIKEEGAVQAKKMNASPLIKGDVSKGISIDPETESDIRALKGNGHPLSVDELDFLEPRFGIDLKDVRLHSNEKAHALAGHMNARAFTVGNDIVLGGKESAADGSSYKKLLAHEMSHVMQQRSGEFALSGSFIQLWGFPTSPGEHQKITKERLDKFRGAFEIEKLHERNYALLIDASDFMDFKIEELIFNVGEKVRHVPIIGPAFGPSGKRQEYYKAHKDNAFNHGEGGLYELEEKDAEMANIAHQKKYMESAKSRFNAIKDNGGYSYDKATQELILGRIIKDIGDALHIAQDRGAHREGTKYLGHDNPDKGVVSDDPRSNDLGHKQAEWNTDLIFIELVDIIIKLMDAKWVEKWQHFERTVRPIEVRHL